MVVTRATAFELPDGGRIDISTETGKYLSPVDPDRYWNNLDISRINPNGKSGVICAIDYDSQNGLVLRVYDEDSADPVYERRIP